MRGGVRSLVQLEPNAGPTVRLNNARGSRIQPDRVINLGTDRSQFRSGDQCIQVVSAVGVTRDANLSQIAQALGAFGSFPGSGESWKKHGGKDGYDGDDDEEFDEGEGRMRDA